MTSTGSGRYGSTERFLANIDEEEVAPIAGEEEDFRSLDLDDGPAADPWYAEGTGDGSAAWSDTGAPDVEAPHMGQEVEAPVFGTQPIRTDDPDAGYDPDAGFDRKSGDGDEAGMDYGDDYAVDLDGGRHDDGPALPVDPDGGVDDEPNRDAEMGAPPPRFSKPLVIGFAGAVAVVTIGVAAAMVGMQSSPAVATSPTEPSATVAVAPPPAPAALPVNDPTQDVPIPFQASSPCPQAGSASAQDVASDDPTRAWVCMRDSDGQVLTMDLGKPMKVTAISITPGWVGTDASGADQWMAHRVVTRVQWILINGADRTVVTQDTKNAHGPVVQPMPSNGPDQGVLASQIQMIVLQTSRPPADSPAPTAGLTTDPSPGGGLLDGVLGAPVAGPEPSTAPSQDPTFGTTDTSNSDPVDNTVAVSSIKILGHPPL
ncbi:hypothetical protein [Mycobacterium sp. URHB0021]